MREGDLARTRWGLWLIALVFLFVTTLAAAQAFPPLTGRIVDQAGILSPETKAAIEPKLADLEDRSGIQLVVATVDSLQGREIEPYANELFRAWKLGEAAKNNGVLLLVAPNERRVRIEVGYGLEGTLTDALSKVIITNAITPRFQVGDFDDGVARGVDDVITVLTTDASEWEERPELPRSTAGKRVAGLAAARRLLRVRHPLHRVLGLPPVRHERALRHSRQLGQRVARWGLLPWRQLGQERGRLFRHLRVGF